MPKRQDPNTPPCVDCESTNTIKKGIKSDKQRYLCKSCYRSFTKTSYTLKLKKEVIALAKERKRQEIKDLGIHNKTARVRNKTPQYNL